MSAPEPSSPRTFRLVTSFCAWISSILKYSNHIWGSCLHARKPCCIRVLAADGFLLCSNSQAAAYVHSPASFGCICRADVKTWNKICELLFLNFWCRMTRHVFASIVLVLLQHLVLLSVEGHRSSVHCFLYLDLTFLHCVSLSREVFCLNHAHLTLSRSHGTVRNWNIDTWSWFYWAPYFDPLI